MSSPSLTKSNHALIVVDVINSCAHKDFERTNWGITFKNIRKMVPKLKLFIEDYKKQTRGKVIFIKTVPWTKERLAKNINELYKDDFRVYYEAGNKKRSVEFFKIDPRYSDKVFEKNTYDAFANPALKSYLKKHKIRYLIIAGIFSDGCVNSTIQGGFSAGFNFIILKDLVETTDSKTRQRLQAHLKKYTWPMMFGDTISSKDCLKRFSNLND